MKIPFSRTVKNMSITAIMKMYINSVSKKWALSNTKKSILAYEWFDMKKNYLPINVKDKVILDVGAGEGETALFYILHGAKGVICVEPDKKCFNNLILNSRQFNIFPFLQPFDIDMLSYFEFDFMKCDIEGYEEVLLNVELEHPSVIEVHGLQLRDKFKEKGYRMGKRYGEKYLPYSTTYAFWKC